MKYSKPEVVVLGSAIVEVQMGIKGREGPLDFPKELHTVGAYEADE